MPVKSVSIINFKSIREAEVELSQINVLIGPNGGGKSNFISFFKFLKNLYDQQLQLYINRNGRADNLLYFGRKKSESLKGGITFDNDFSNQYFFEMVPDQSGNLIFKEEWSNYHDPSQESINRSRIYSLTGFESEIKTNSSYRNFHLRKYFDSFRIYHFHDTGFDSKIKQPTNTTDYSKLHEDGGNLAAFLYRLQESRQHHFGLIESVIQSIAPFFYRFYLKPDEINPGQIYLRWQERGTEQLFSAHNLSDGTLRMICLTTLLLQPDMKGTIIIDEPELGLHPFAISKLVSMIQSASKNTQIIISTQSVTLLNHFLPEDVIVVERENEQSVFKRLDEEELSSWLGEYSLGELWDKNVIGGRP